MTKPSRKTTTPSRRRASRFGGAGVRRSARDRHAARSTVGFMHNGWRQLTMETQGHTGATSRAIQYGYASGAANTIRRQTVTYPSGSTPSTGPAVAYTYSSPHADALSRPGMVQAEDTRGPRTQEDRPLGKKAAIT